MRFPLGNFHSDKEELAVAVGDGAEGEVRQRRDSQAEGGQSEGGQSVRWWGRQAGGQMGGDRQREQGGLGVEPWGDGLGGQSRGEAEQSEMV